MSENIKLKRLITNNYNRPKQHIKIHYKIKNLC